MEKYIRRLFGCYVVILHPVNKPLQQKLDILEDVSPKLYGLTVSGGIDDTDITLCSNLTA
jgi:hypothetical protein